MGSPLFSDVGLVEKPDDAGKGLTMPREISVDRFLNRRHDNLGRVPIDVRELISRVLQWAPVRRGAH